MTRLLSHPLPSRQQVVSLSQSSCESLVELTDEGGGGGGTKSNDREKGWPAINHLIFSFLQEVSKREDFTCFTDSRNALREGREVAIMDV